MPGTRETSSTTRPRPAPQLDQKQFGFVVGGPVMLPGYDGRNRTFFLVNYEGTRIDRGATNFYTVPTPAGADGTLQHADHRSGDAARRSRTTPFRSRDSRGSRSWPSGTTGSRHRTRTAAQGNYQAVRTFPQVQDQFTIRGDQDLARYRAACSSAIRTPPTRTRPPSNIDRGRQPCLRTGHAELAGVPQLADSEHGRQPVPDGPRGSARGPARNSVRAGRRGLPQCAGRVHEHSGRPARVSEHRDQRLLGHRRRGQRLHRQQSADVGHQQYDDVGQRAAHVELRVQLSPLVAPARSGDGVPRQLRVQRRVHAAISSPTCCSGTTRVWACSNRRHSVCREPPATRASSTSSTSRRTSRTTGASTRN